MALSRRSFLQAVLGSAAALAILPKIDLLAAATADETPTGPAWLATYRAVHEEAWRILRLEMAKRGLPIQAAHVTPGGGLGYRHPDGTVLTDHLGVDAGARMPISADIMIVPAMVHLAEHAVSYGLDRFGAQGLPRGTDYAGNIGPLRMVVLWDCLDAQHRLRFDILGGASPAGQRVKARALKADRVSWATRRIADDRARPASRLPA